MIPTADPVLVSLAVDDRYAAGAAVVLASAADHLSVHGLHANVVDMGLSEAGRRLIAHAASHVTFLTPDTCLHQTTKTLPLSNDDLVRHANTSMFGRLLLPHLLSESEHRCIYLDSDVLVLADLGELWEMDLDGFPVGAVADRYVSGEHSRAVVGSVADADFSHNVYFNSGVLLIDLVSWRNHAITERAVAYLGNRYGLVRYPDQDALNAVLAGRWKRLAERWNVPIGESSKGHAATAVCEPRPSEDVGISGQLWHFLGPTKPWRIPCLPARLQRRYQSYLAKVCSSLVV